MLDEIYTEWRKKGLNYARWSFVRYYGDLDFDFGSSPIEIDAHVLDYIFQV